ncbi:hypothetical protein GJ496_001194 [Pomphorhynchus laevis]|nr:hypothetical protein GJ496_001194 [Pomphorhynchus laevis]
MINTIARLTEHKWNNLQRSCVCDADWLLPLVSSIRSMLKCLIGSDPASDDILWQIYSLSVLNGGIAIKYPSTYLDGKYEASRRLCKHYTDGLTDIDVNLRQLTVYKEIQKIEYLKNSTSDIA